MKGKKLELLDDYRMLEEMSEKLRFHQKKMKVVGKTVARSLKNDAVYGITEKIESAISHMEKAAKELDRAKKEIELL
jgi:predicted Ser/Thr protein kinase